MKWTLTIRLKNVPHPFIDLRDENGNSLAFAHNPSQETINRFRLMAAAPALYEAVKGICAMDEPDCERYVAKADEMASAPLIEHGLVGDWEGRAFS